jgi:hypothetical protein
MMRLWAEFITDNQKVRLADGREREGGAPWLLADAGSIYDAPAVSAGQLHVSDWPLYDNGSQACLNIELPSPTLVNNSRDPACQLWDATLQRGLMRVPPQTPEPFLR